MQLTLFHYIFMALAVLLILAPGFYAARQIKDADDFNVGGRSAGPGLVAGTIVGTIIGGSATVGTAQLAFHIGLTAWWFTLGSGIALFIMAAFYARPLRNSGLTTVAEYLEQNFGVAAGWIATIASCGGIFFSIVANTLTSLHMVAGVCNINLVPAAVLMLVITMGLVLFGGISGSGMSGIVRIVLLFLSLFTGGYIAYTGMGGYVGIHTTFPEFPWFSLFGRGVEDGLVALFSMVVGVISTQTYIQALFSARDSKTASIGCFTAGVIAIPMGLPSILIGMFMHVNHPTINAIEALPLFLATYLPPWIGGLGIAVVMLSSLSSIGGLALGIGTLVARNVIGEIYKNFSAKALLQISRLCVFITAVGAIVFVFFHLDSSVLAWNYLSMALRGSAVFLPMTYCVLFPHEVRASMGVAAMGAGLFAALTWKWIGAAVWDVNPLFPALVYNLIFLVIGHIWGDHR